MSTLWLLSLGECLAVTCFLMEVHNVSVFHPLCSASAPEKPRWTDWPESLSICLPKADGKETRTLWCTAACVPGAAGWMHRIFHPNKCAPTSEYFFRLTTEAPLGFQSSPLSPIFKCTVPRLAMLVLSTAVMKLSEVKQQANVLRFSLQIWFWFHLNGSIPNCLPIAKT